MIKRRINSKAEYEAITVFVVCVGEWFVLGQGTLDERVRTLGEEGGAQDGRREG